LTGPLHNLADLRRQQDPSRALALIEEALRITESQDRRDPITFADHLMLRGVIFHAAADHDRAIQDFRHALALRQEHLGLGHAETADAVYSLAIALEAAGRFEAAEAPLRQLVEAWPVEPPGSGAPPRPWDRPYTQAKLGQALLAAGRKAEAQPWLELGRARLLELGRQDLVNDLGLHEAIDRIENSP
jgi:tetratricopeptide (TPR) repeat protein